MLIVPETSKGTMKQEPPCYRCLFQKPIDDAWCDPETCVMLDKWLQDEDFSWQKYYTGFILNIELKKKLKSQITEEE